MSPLELTAALFGVVCVALTIRRSIWCWPTGLVMVAFYIAVFYRARLYSDMGLQVVYVFLQIYGWAVWAKGRREEGEVRVVRLGRAGAAASAGLAVAGSGLLGFLMSRYTDADLAYGDATATVLSLVAQFLMGRKVLESWVVWIAVDVLSVGIYAAKGLYLTLGLYVLFLGMATAGFFAWKKSWDRRLEPARA